MHDIEGEFDDDVLARRLGVGDDVAAFVLQFGKYDRDGDVDRFRMPAGVVGVVGECAQRERELVQIARASLSSAPTKSPERDVVHEVAEELVAERVVAEILNHRSAVRERPRESDRRRGARKSPLEQRLQRRVPRDVNGRFVTEDRVWRADWQ